MVDGRRNNGGHSTKKKDGIDKRKNSFRHLIAQTITEEDVSLVLTNLRDKAIEGKDLKAVQLFLEYTLGKPDQKIEMDGAVPVIDMSQWK